MKHLSIVLLPILIFAAVLLSGCNFFTQPVDLQTENLENEVAQTQIAIVRATATVNADRLMITLEGVQTAVGSANLQSTRMASTLIAQGTLIVDASGITPVYPTAAPQDNNGSPNPPIANPLLTPGAPSVSGDGSAQGDSALVPLAPTPLAQATIDPNQPSLFNIALAEQVGSDDCPVNPATSFSSSATDIYVVAVANNVPSGTLLSSTWMHDGEQAAHYEWTPDFNVRGACIWFHIPADEVTFTPGNWSVELAINGTPVGAPTLFTITGSTPVQINVTSEVSG